MPSDTREGVLSAEEASEICNDVLNRPLANKPFWLQKILKSHETLRRLLSGSEAREAEAVARLREIGRRPASALEEGVDY